MANMDVDEINDEYLLEWFDLSENAFPWREDVAAIHARRSLMGGALFIDTLLPAAADARLLGDSDDSMDEGSSAGPLYPPTDPAMFRRLLHALQRSPHSSSKRDSIALYFLCAWYPAAAADPNGFSTGADGEPYANALDDAKLRKFTQALLIQPHIASIVRAYYLLDHGQLEPAVALLSDARILPEWSSKVLNTLALPGLDVTAPLVLKYIRCAKPTLSDWDDMTIYLSALVKTSLMDAWLYQRSFPNGPLRQQFIRRILDLCLTPEHRPEQLKLLVAFPFDEAEEATIRSYAQEPPDAVPPKSLAVLRQLLLVRLIQAGKYTEALKFDRAMPVPDRDEARIKERQALMRHVLNLIPPAQREEVEREYSQQVQAQAHAQTNGITTAPASPAVPSKRVPSVGGSWAHVGREQDLSMSMSWEDLGTARQAPSPALNFGDTRRTSLSRLEGPAIPSIGTPTKRGTDSPARPRGYGNANSQSTSASPFRTSMAKPFPRPTYQPVPPARTSGTVTPSKRPLPESPHLPPVLGMQGLGEIQMVESDDPDAFVVRPPRAGVSLPPPRKEKAREKERRKPAEPAPEREPEIPALPPARPTVPGAFPEDREQEEEQEQLDARRHHRSKRQRQGENFELEPVVQQQLPPAKAPTKASTRVRKSTAAAAPQPVPRKTRARRPSMPGEMPDLGDSDGTEESEQEDTLPALPRTTTRRSVAAPTGGRKSRASSSEPEQPSGPVRRSSRLSSATSITEEPAPAPAKTKKPTSARRRASVEPAAAAAGTSRMATRRSRMMLDGVEE